MTEKQYLTQDELAFVHKAGTERHWANLTKKNIADYDESRFNLTSLQANRLGVFAEAVAFKYLGGDILNHSLWDWPSFVPNDHTDYAELLSRADLWGCIEVRRANSDHSPIPSRAKDRELDVPIIQVWVPYSQPLASRDNPFPGIKPHGYGVITGWCWPTDPGKVPQWNKTDSLVHERRSIHTLDLGAIRNG